MNINLQKQVWSTNRVRRSKLKATKKSNKVLELLAKEREQFKSLMDKCTGI